MYVRIISKIAEMGVLITLHGLFLLVNNHVTNKKHLTGTGMYLILSQLMSFSIVSWYKHNEAQNGK